MPRPRAPSFDHTPLSLPPDHTLVQLATAQGSGNYLSVDPDGEERLVEVSTKVKRAKVLIVKGEPGCTGGRCTLRICTGTGADPRRLCVRPVVSPRREGRW